MYKSEVVSMNVEGAYVEQIAQASYSVSTEQPSEHEVTSPSELQLLQSQMQGSFKMPLRSQ